MSNAIIPLLFIAAFILFAFFIQISFFVTRPRKLREFADKQHLVYLNDDLPVVPSELLDWLSLSLEVRNCIHGRRHGEQVFAFDYARGWGRQKRWSTVVALEQNHPRQFSPVRLRDSFRYGKWVIATRKSYRYYLLSGDEILQEWDAMRTATEQEALAASNHLVAVDTVIRPQHELRR